MYYTQHDQNILWDHELAITRNLGVIAQITEQVRDRLPFQKQLTIFNDYIQAMRENTDAAMEVITHTPPEVTELHRKRCLENSVEYCTCLPNRSVGTGEPL